MVVTDNEKNDENLGMDIVQGSRSLNATGYLALTVQDTVDRPKEAVADPQEQANIEAADVRDLGVVRKSG